MKIEDYLSIPIKQKRQKRYLIILKLVMSLVAGIFIILLSKIFNQSEEHSNQEQLQVGFEISVLLLLTTLVKSVYFFNFKYKSQDIPGIQPSLSSKQIIIPSLIKCFLHLGIMKIGIIHIYSLDGICILALNIIFIEYFRIKVPKQNSNLLRQILKVIFLLGAMTLSVKRLQFNQSLITNLFMVTFGTLSLISFYDLSDKVFEIYKPSVQQFMAKQYIIELLIYAIYVTFCLLVENQLSQTLFIIEKFPYITLFIFFGATSQYAILQFLKRKKFGQLVFSFFCGQGWALMYFLKNSSIPQQRFIYGLVCFAVSFIILMDIFSSDKILRIVHFMFKNERSSTRYITE